jgi:hypothetical protein
MKTIDKQGKNSRNSFLARTDSDVVNSLYSTNTIIKKIKNLYNNKERIEILDVGAHSGDLSCEIGKKAIGKKFKITAVDSDKKALSLNKSADYLKHMDVSKDFLPIKKYDVAIIRYVLHWNKKKNHEFIIKNTLNSVRKGILLINIGPKTEQAKHWRGVIKKIFNTNKFGLKRSSYFFPTNDDIKRICKRNGWSCVGLEEDKKIEPLSEILSVKYALGKINENEIKRILGDYNYLIKTSLWITKN